MKHGVNYLGLKRVLAGTGVFDTGEAHGSPVVTSREVFKKKGLTKVTACIIGQRKEEYAFQSVYTFLL